MQAFAVAKRSGDKQDWKYALRLRDTVRRAWKRERLDRAAAGDWQAIKQCRQGQLSGWESTLAEHISGDAHQAVHDHFCAVFDHNGSPPSIEAPIPTAVPDFTLDELQHCMSLGKHQKSVSTDLISQELLEAVVEGGNAPALLEWMNHLLHCRALPAKWAENVLVLLPKVPSPTRVGQLRPIAMGSAVCKLFSRLLLHRTFPAIRQTNSWQCAAPHRQPTDYIHSLLKTFELEREWKAGVCWCKVDIAKAYDRVSRQTLVDRLADTLGNTELLHCWLHILQHTDAIVQSPWGQTKVHMRSGIKQGAIESPAIFTAIMQWIFEQASREYGWSSCPCFEGLGIEQVCYMDDGVLWTRGPEQMEARLRQLGKVLAEWGLSLNAEKCQVYMSPHCKRVQPLRVQDTLLQPDTHILVMGLQMRVGQCTGELLGGLMSRARNSFWSLKHVLTTKGNLRKRLHVLDTAVGGLLLWCVAGIPRRMLMGIKRRTGELGYEHRTRMHRAARVQIHSLSKRWSAVWFGRYWDYMGHCARGADLPFSPPSSLLVGYRDLQCWRREQANPFGKRHGGRFFLPRQGSLETPQGCLGATYGWILHGHACINSACKMT